jgi:hypothetical protein
MTPIPAIDAAPAAGPSLMIGPDGRPRPIDPATGLPAMTKQEADWWAHLAHMRASAEARASGDGFATVAAAAAAQEAPPHVAGRPMLPFSTGHFLLLEMLGSTYTAPNPDGAPRAVTMREMVRVTWVLLHPEKAMQLLEAKRTEDLDAAASAFALRVTTGDFARVNEWVNREMGHFRGAAAEESKKPSPAGPPPTAGEPAANPSPVSLPTAPPPPAGA